MTNYVLLLLFQALAAVEGGERHRDGVLQVSRIMFQDYRQHNRGSTLTLAGARTPQGAFKVLAWYSGHYSPDAGVWTLAARWNAGPDGDRQALDAPGGRVADYAGRAEALFWAHAEADMARGEWLLRKERFYVNAK